MEKLRGADDPATLTAANSLALLLEAWRLFRFSRFFYQRSVCHQVEKCHLSSECCCLSFAVVESPLIVNLHLVLRILGWLQKRCVKPATCSFLLDAVGVQNLQNPGNSTGIKKMSRSIHLHASNTNYSSQMGGSSRRFFLGLPKCNLHLGIWKILCRLCVFLCFSPYVSWFHLLPLKRRFVANRPIQAGTLQALGSGAFV